MKKQPNAAPAPATPATTTHTHASATLAPGDLPEPTTIAAVPEGYKPMDGATRQALLKVFVEQRAEVDQAMEQLWTKRVELADDLGKLAPDADQGHALAERMIAAREANRKAQALAMYTDEQEALANHAVIGHINSVSREIEHMAERIPQIAERYPKVLAVIAQRRKAIAAGIARAKANKAADPKKGPKPSEPA